MNQSSQIYIAHNIFFARFVSSQICDDRSQRVFFAQMTSCTMRYDVICHPFPINSQYLKKWGADSPAMHHRPKGKINAKEEVEFHNKGN